MAKKQPLWTVITPNTRIEFTYLNHEGKLETREATFLGIDYGSNSWYPERQFFLRCKAHDRGGAERSFAIAKIDGETLRKTDMTW
jgi:hypothetical protein